MDTNLTAKPLKHSYGPNEELVVGCENGRELSGLESKYIYNSYNMLFYYVTSFVI